MVYDIEFIRRVDDRAEALALDIIKIVGDNLASVLARAEELYRSVDTVPRPNGYRVREVGGAIVHEFTEELPA
jgi:hypothetical protein